MDYLIELVRRAFAYFRNLVRRVINGILSFARDIVAWFRGLSLDPKKDIPFVAKGETFKEMLDRAPVKSIGLFKGVYNKETDEIEHAEFIEADSLDNETRNLIDSDPLVVLS